jgi:hypothetical protein
MAGFSKQSNDPSGSENCEKSLERAIICKLGCIPWRLFDSYYELVTCLSLRTASSSGFLQVP